VLVFPDDFLDSDGRFVTHVGPRAVPVIYVAANGYYVCAACLNDAERHNGEWAAVNADMINYGPVVQCARCSRNVAPLHPEDEMF